MKSLLILTLLLFARLLSFSQEAAQLYQTHCASCHGNQCQGGSAQSLVDDIWQFGGPPEHIDWNTKKGLPHLGMPAFGDTLTDPQIRQITTYLRGPAKKERTVAAPLLKMLHTLDYKINVEVWAKGLEIPWSLAFIDQNTALVTERAGRLRVIENGRLHSKPVAETPTVLAEGQGGLLAVAFAPDYAAEDNQWVYLAYSHGLKIQPNGKRAPAMTKVVRGRIHGNQWVDEEILFESPHESYRTTRQHYGTRIVFDAKGDLYFSIGDRGTGAHAQDLSKPNGKIHRIRRDGSIPRHNPFRRNKTALPSIFSYGNRNPQGLAFHPDTDQLWSTEHGPKGGDELNLIQSGLNYGWPIITYGKNYNGTPITDLVRRKGMEQPVFYWTPSAAVCGIDFYHGELFPKWNNKLLVGSLKYEDVRLLHLENNRVIHEEIILQKAGRVRDVVCGPDGAIYVVLNDPGTILRLSPAKEK